MDPFRLAVKSFVINEREELLLIKRSVADVHKPGLWEVPGGRLELGEDPFAGLKRETKEETGLDIQVKNPLRIHHFVRDDGQKITMITFLCQALSNSIVLSDEHSEFVWLDLDTARAKIASSFHEDIRIIQKYHRAKLR